MVNIQELTIVQILSVVFSCEFSKMLKNNFFYKTFPHDDYWICGPLHSVKSVQILSFFLVCIFLFPTEFLYYGPEKTQYLDTFHAVLASKKLIVIVS